jgi:hypothetical protein
LLLVNQDVEEEENLQNEATREEAQEQVPGSYSISCHAKGGHCIVDYAREID